MASNDQHPIDGTDEDDYDGLRGFDNDIGRAQASTEPLMSFLFGATPREVQMHGSRLANTLPEMNELLEDNAKLDLNVEISRKSSPRPRIWGTDTTHLLTLKQFQRSSNTLQVNWRLWMLPWVRLSGQFQWASIDSGLEVSFGCQKIVVFLIDCSMCARNTQKQTKEDPQLTCGAQVLSIRCPV